jgi:hypothetical protein
MNTTNIKTAPPENKQMDCTNFEGYPFHHRQPDVDIQREIIRSVAATAVFLALLGITATILAIHMSQGPADQAEGTATGQFTSMIRYQYNISDSVGYLACALVLATFSMKSMRPLRVTAIASNIAFLVYAFSIHLPPIFVLHGILLPLNIFRLAQVERARRMPVRFQANADSPDDPAIVG